MMDFLTGLESSGFGTWVRQSESLFAFPGILFCHTLGLSLVVGISTLISLRILGIAATVPMEPIERLYPYMWGRFCLNAVSGVMLFMPSATVKAVSPVFYTKMAFIAVAVVLMALIRTRVLRGPLVSQEPIVMNGRILAWASLFCWLGAIVSGRLLAYVGPGTASAL